MTPQELHSVKTKLIALRSGWLVYDKNQRALDARKPARPENLVLGVKQTKEKARALMVDFKALVASLNDRD